jgi:hypothetical protein
LRSVAKSRWRARWTVGHGSPSLCQSRDSRDPLEEPPAA